MLFKALNPLLDLERAPNASSQFSQFHCSFSNPELYLTTTMFAPARSPTHKSCQISNGTFASALQFTSCMGNGAWSKFSSLYFLEHGVTPSQLAVINSVQSFAKLIGYPTLSALCLCLIDQSLSSTFHLKSGLESLRITSTTASCCCYAASC